MDTDNNFPKIILAVLASVGTYIIGFNKSEDPVVEQPKVESIIDNQAILVPQDYSTKVYVDGKDYSTGWIPPSNR